MEREYVKKGTPHCGASALPTNITPPHPESPYNLKQKQMKTKINKHNMHTTT